MLTNMVWYKMQNSPAFSTIKYNVQRHSLLAAEALDYTFKWSE